MFYAQSNEKFGLVYYSDTEQYSTGIPSSAVAITDSQWQDSINNPGKYTIQNGQFVLAPPPTVAQQLASAQTTKIAELRASYVATLKSGFNATINNTTYTFGWTTDDKSTLDAMQTSIERGFLTFPIKYADINGNPVTLSAQTDVDVIERTATNFFNAQHQQILTFIANAQSATTVDAVNAIQWTPATY